MLPSFGENKASRLPDGCIGAGIFCAMLKEPLTGSGELSGVSDQNAISIASNAQSRYVAADARVAWPIGASERGRDAPSARAPVAIRNETASKIATVSATATRMVV
jgi:hypothetical protein